MIRIYTAKHCAPCHEIERIIKEKKIDGVELIDIESDEGFRKFKDEVLVKGDGEVPSAYKDGKRCAIMIDDDNIILDCPSPSSSTE